MKAVPVNESEGGYQHLSGFDRQGHDWDGADAWEKDNRVKKSGAAILLNQIIKYLRSGGGSINSITDQDGQSWGSFTFSFNNGNFIASLGINFSVSNYQTSASKSGGHGSSNENIGEKNKRLFTFNFEKKLYSTVFGVRKAAWTLRGHGNVSETMDENGQWKIDDWNAENVETNIIKNTLFGGTDEVDYYYMKHYEGDKQSFPVSTIYDGGAYQSIDGTVFHRYYQSVDNFRIPIGKYDMWIFNVTVRISTPFQANKLDVSFNYVSKKYGIVGRPPGY